MPVSWRAAVRSHRYNATRSSIVKIMIFRERQPGIIRRWKGTQNLGRTRSRLYFGFVAKAGVVIDEEMSRGTRIAGKLIVRRTTDSRFRIKTIGTDVARDTAKLARSVTRIFVSNRFSVIARSAAVSEQPRHDIFPQMNNQSARCIVITWLRREISAESRRLRRT